MKTHCEARSKKQRVLICEDESIVALDLKFIVEDLGYEVVGPFATVRDGLRAAGEAEVDAAILDVRLRDGEVFPIADSLNEKGTPLIFHSGHVLTSEILETYPDAKVCQKPVRTSALTKWLVESMRV